MISKIVIKEISSQLDSNSIVVTENKLFKEDLGLPSIKMIMILTNLSLQLDFSIMDFADYEIIRLKSVGDLINLLKTKVNKL